MRSRPSTVTAANDQIIILNSTAYATAALAEDAVVALDDATGTNAAGAALVFWQDTVGTVYLSVDADIDGDAGALLNLASFTGITIADVATNLNNGDFTFA